ncbi:hypothetical protein V6N13_021431 [Hibiscus sabdariffa]|uniref:Uncharacterized protein n=1 Tax=Hibiscus sabdariffa TaxID=183260 RepID=A0ABR2NQ82_9ROSI
MASANPPSSPPLPSSPPSVTASHCESSPAVPSALVPPQAQPDAAANENGTLNVDEQKPQIFDHFAILDDPEHIEKYKKYEVDYTRRLLAKYFSNKNFYGGGLALDHLQTQFVHLRISAMGVRFPSRKPYLTSQMASFHSRRMADSRTTGNLSNSW